MTRIIGDAADAHGLTSETVDLTIDVAATPETVFGFLTESASFREWMGATSEMAASGSQPFTVRFPNGDEAVGRIVEAIPGRRVVYAWGYTDGRHQLAPGASQVSLELTGTPLGTRLSLRHSGLPSADSRAAHMQGWQYYCGVLAARAADRQTGRVIGDLVAAWVLAWNTGDSAALDRCCAAEVLYVDRLTRVSGREALARYIANARAFAPAARVEVEPVPTVTQQFARFEWRMCADGRVLATGAAFAELSIDGLFVRVVSFWN